MACHRSRGENLVWALQVDLGWYTAFWLLAVAGACASSVTIEREEDTWVEPDRDPADRLGDRAGEGAGGHLEPARLRRRADLPLVGGPGHRGGLPRGILASIAVVALLTWLAAAIGVHASMRSHSTSRAVALTILAVGLFNGYQFLLIAWFLEASLGQ